MIAQPPVNPTLQNLLETLKNAGATEKELVDLTESVTKAAAAKFYTEVMANLTKEDIEAINLAKNQEEADTLIQDKFRQRTGKDAHQIKDQILGDIAKEHFETYSRSQH